MKDVSNKDSFGRYNRDELLQFYSPYYRPPANLEQIEKLTSKVPLTPAAHLTPSQLYATTEQPDVCNRNQLALSL